MSYDIDIIDPKTGKVVEANETHIIGGGTYVVGGTRDLSLNITYNYAKHFYRLLGDKGIRVLYGKKVSETLVLLAKATGQLGDDVNPDYWQPTEGNVKKAILDLISLGAMAIAVCPDAVWEGD